MRVKPPCVLVRTFPISTGVEPIVTVASLSVLKFVSVIVASLPGDEISFTVPFEFCAPGMGSAVART